MVGLPETTVKEARDRVRSAIINSGYEFPAKKITINLTPADLPKEGGRYDLPIAVALLAASEQLTASNLEAYELVGELALTGVNATMFDRYLPFSCPLNTFVTDAVRFAPFHHH